MTIVLTTQQKVRLFEQVLKVFQRECVRSADSYVLTLAAVEARYHNLRERPENDKYIDKEKNVTDGQQNCLERRQRRTIR